MYFNHICKNSVVSLYVDKWKIIITSSKYSRFLCLFLTMSVSISYFTTCSIEGLLYECNKFRI